MNFRAQTDNDKTEDVLYSQHFKGKAKKPPTLTYISYDNNQNLVAT